MVRTRPTQRRLKELLGYNPTTGIFTWRVRRGGSANAGSIAGMVGNFGYRFIGIDGWKYPEHRLVWVFIHGKWPKELDHINRDRADNRLLNLRIVTRSENCSNRGLSRNNTTGFKGVYNCGDRGWSAVIRVRGNKMWFGYFDTALEAHNVYVETAIRLRGEFAYVT